MSKDTPESDEDCHIGKDAPEDCQIGKADLEDCHIGKELSQVEPLTHVPTKHALKLRRLRARQREAPFTPLGPETDLPPAPYERRSVVRALWKLILQSDSATPGVAAVAKVLGELMAVEPEKTRPVASSAVEEPINSVPSIEDERPANTVPKARAKRKLPEPLGLCVTDEEPDPEFERYRREDAERCGVPYVPLRPLGATLDDGDD